MHRSTVVAGLAAAGIIAGTWSTVAAADTDPCADVAPAYQALMEAEGTWSGTNAALAIATDMHLANRDRIAATLAADTVSVQQASAAYDAARDACAGR